MCFCGSCFRFLIVEEFDEKDKEEFNKLAKAQGRLLHKEFIKEKNKEEKK